MSVKRYSADLFDSSWEPIPSERPDDYETSGVWACVWGRWPGRGITVERVGDDQPAERYGFDTADDPENALGVIATPTKRTVAKADPHVSNGGTVAVEYPRGRYPNTRSESISVEDLPSAVKRRIESEKGVRVVESLYDTADGE